MSDRPDIAEKSSGRDDIPAHALADITEKSRAAIRALFNEDYRDVMFHLDLIRERASWVEKMMWRRLNAPAGDKP